MIKRFLLAASAAIFAAGGPALARPDVSAHVDLIRTIEDLGVIIKINDTEECEEGLYGAYVSRNYNRRSIFLLCQENRNLFNDNVVGLTEEDADTIRHEAWHMVQDCVYGGMGDAHIRPIYTTPEEVVDFAFESGMDEATIRRIIKAYDGEEEHVIIAEIEAFTVAMAWSADDVNHMVSKYCEAL